MKVRYTLEYADSVPDRIEITYFDRKGRATDKDKAVTMLVCEYDADGKLLRQYLAAVSQNAGQDAKKKR